MSDPEMTTFGMYPEPEPVAWKMKGVPAFATSRPNDTDSIKWEALYAAPPKKEWVGQPEPEELARLEQAMIEAWKPIPKREWVGLTEQEKKGIFDACEPDERSYVIAMTEALLKEKNS